MDGATDQRITLVGPQVTLDAQPALHLAMIIHELGTNARKHGSLSTPEGRLAVSWTLEIDGARRLKLNWRESGGPMVAAPATRGFGTTLVEKSLAAHEGQACIHYRAEGLSCDIELPLPELPAYAKDFAARAGATGGAPMSTRSEPRSTLAAKRILVVEDEPIVALDLAGALSEQGCVVVGPAGTLEDARRLARTEALDAALVDANLNGAPADDIAVALAERRVPFAFVTGYDRGGLPADFQQAAMINKPFSREEIIGVVRTLVGVGATKRTKADAKS
jgi:CheY-like chemotaxis protein